MKKTYMVIYNAVENATIMEAKLELALENLERNKELSFRVKWRKPGRPRWRNSPTFGTRMWSFGEN